MAEKTLAQSPFVRLRRQSQLKNQVVASLAFAVDRELCEQLRLGIDFEALADVLKCKPELESVRAELTNASFDMLMGAAAILDMTIDDLMIPASHVV